MKQADLGLSVDELVARQDWLQARVRALDERLGLVRMLGRYGRASIGGSFETGLMVWPDIDLTVVTPGDPAMRDVLDAAEHLVEAGVWKFNVADHRARPVPGVPRGVYLGPKVVEDDDLEWQVDIWFTDEADETARVELAERIRAGLIDETRRAILAIKQVAAASDRYHRGVSSVDLYLAVLDHGVRDPAGFERHLAERGLSLWTPPCLSRRGTPPSPGA